MNYDVNNVEIENGSAQSFLIFGPTFFTNPDVPGDWTPLFAVGTENEPVNQVALDFVAPEGLWSPASTAASTLYNLGRNALQVYIQRFDAASNTWVQVSNVRAASSVSGNRYSSVLDSYIAQGNTRARYNFKLTFNFSTAGRYRFAVRSRGISFLAGDSNFFWNGLRGRIAEVRDANNQITSGNVLQNGITYLSVAIRTSERFTSLDDLKISAICQSKGKTLGVSGISTGDSAYDSPIDAVLNILLAIGWDTTRIDTGAMRQIKIALANRGDTYNAVLDRVTDAWTTIKNVLKPFRCIPIIDSAGVFTIVRDDSRTLVSQLFTQRSIKQGTFSVLQNLAPDEVKDGVTIRFVDKDNNYETNDVSVTATGGIPVNPKVVRLRGITNRVQARREALYRARVNQYRRLEVKFTTEAEGLLLDIGDKVLVQHDTMKWGESGEIWHVEAVGNDWRLILSEPVTFTADINQVYNMRFRRKQAGVTNTLLVKQLPVAMQNADYASNQQVLIADAEPSFLVTRDADNNVIEYHYRGRQVAGGRQSFIDFYGLDGKSELTQYIFGDDAKECVVREVKSRGTNETTITLDIEDNRIYAD